MDPFVQAAPEQSANRACSNRLVKSSKSQPKHHVRIHARIRGHHTRSSFKSVDIGINSWRHLVLWKRDTRSALINDKSAYFDSYLIFPCCLTKYIPCPTWLLVLLLLLLLLLPLWLFDGATTAAAGGVGLAEVVLLLPRDFLLFVAASVLVLPLRRLATDTSSITQQRGYT